MITIMKTASSCTANETRIVYGFLVLPTPSTNVCSNINPLQANPAQTRRNAESYTKDPAGAQAATFFFFSGASRCVRSKQTTRVKKLYFATFTGVLPAGFAADGLAPDFTGPAATGTGALSGPAPF